MRLDNERKEESIIEASLASKLDMIHFDFFFDVESAVKDTQKRICSKLKVEPKFSITLDNTQKLLKFIDTHIDLVILHVDLVSSTRLSMNLPLKRSVPII